MNLLLSKLSSKEIKTSLDSLLALFMGAKPQDIKEKEIKNNNVFI
jgi:hypothetical protein